VKEIQDKKAETEGRAEGVGVAITLHTPIRERPTSNLDLHTGCNESGSSLQPNARIVSRLGPFLPNPFRFIYRIFRRCAVKLLASLQNT
jgi:hypothetical protein